MLIKIIPPNTKYGRLTITGNYELRKASKNNIAYFECICDCGNIIWARGSNIRYGSTRSCGCRVGQKYKHNSSKTRLYRIWNNMRSRCNAPKIASYKNYGARGIKVCDEWDNVNDGFHNFQKWALSNGYFDNLTLDRIDVNGNYEPSNCRWVTQYEQSRNKRTNRFLEVNGAKKIITDVAKEHGINVKTLQDRLDRGYSLKEALEKELPNKRLIYYKEQFLTPRQFSEVTGINFNTIMTRMTKGYIDAEDLIVPDRNIFLRKSVNQYDLEGNFIASYPSASEAARKNNCCKSGVIECCNGKKSKFKNWVFKYIEEVEVNNG